MLQNRYSLHYKLCYRTGTGLITWSSASWPHVAQERSESWSQSWCSCNASPGRFATPVPAPADKTSHTLSYCYNVCERFRETENLGYNLRTGIKLFPLAKRPNHFPFFKASQPFLCHTQMGLGIKLTTSLYLLHTLKRRGTVLPNTHTLPAILIRQSNKYVMNVNNV